jgi:hypothetical protein
MSDFAVYCADIGSVRTKKFGWATDAPLAASENNFDTTSIDGLCSAVEHSLRRKQRVALGFETPLFIPVPAGSKELGRARKGEGDKPWSAGAGAAVIATGMAQTAWILRKLRTALPNEKLYLDWGAFSAARTGLFVWEAFVSGSSKPKASEGNPHVADASAAIAAFRGSIAEATETPPVNAESPLSLIGAAALWAGWTDDTSVLKAQPVVILPE